MKSILAIAGRILYALPMIIFGFGHLTNANAISGMVPVPGGIVWVYITGAALIAAGLSIIIKKKAALATLLLGIMLLIFVLTIHLPGMTSGDQSKIMMSMPNFLKDLALAGAAFFMSSTFKD